MAYWFFGIAMIFLAIYIALIASQHTKKFFRKSKKISEIEDEHERICKQLKELKANLFKKIKY